MPISQLVPVVLPEFLVKRITFNTKPGRTVWSDQGVEFELDQWRDTGKANGGPDGRDLDRKDDEYFRNPILFSTDADRL